ncbi:MAG: hypothetical protein ACOY37_03065 [Pseudomonadota bacterium]
MHHTPRTPRPLPRTLAAALMLAMAAGAAAPAFAQATDDPAIVESATVPKSRLVERYTELAGSQEAASSLIERLRTGSDFTVTETVTTTVTNPDGTTSTQTSTVERTIENTAGPMGWGEVNITLSLAQALVDSGKYADLQSALSGTTTTVTNPDGTTSTTTTGGVLALRADGMGWGAIAKELGFNLGTLISAGNRGEKATAAKSDKAATARGEKAAAKPDRVAKGDRPTRPDRVERPAKPERPTRPERPAKPERGGRG